MRLLLDTHLLLWAAQGSPRLTAEARALIGDADNIVMFSPVSLAEISIKHAMGRPDFVVEPRVLRRSLLDNGYEELALTSEHAVTVGELPPIHKDPFDRLLIAQAMVEGVTLLTADTMVAGYPGPIRPV